MTNSLLDEQLEELGAQRPRICSAPVSGGRSGDDAIGLAEIAGLELDPWQQFVLRWSLGERGDGKWAAPTVGLVCPRQNGKNAILEARELAGLILFDERNIIHSAHEQNTASNQFGRLLNLLESTPKLRRRMKRAIHGKGSEAIEMANGAVIAFKTRTSGAGRGLSYDLIVYDEAYNLPETVISALAPTKSARPNTQTIYTSSAVDKEKHPHGAALTRQRERGIAGSPRFAYFEWSAEGDDPSDVPREVAGDPKVWADANPGYGIRITEENVRLEFDGDMGPREFAVERLGIGDWPRGDGDTRIIPRAEWLECADPNSSPTQALAFGIDAEPFHHWASIVVAAERDDGATHIQVHERLPGTEWVVDACLDLKAANPRAVFVIDGKGPAAHLIEELENKRIKVIEIETRGYVHACQDFVDAVRRREVRFIPPELDLDDAMAGASKRDIGDAWGWSRKNSHVDITPLVAATLALWGAKSAPKPRPRVISLAQIAAEMDAEEG